MTIAAPTIPSTRSPEVQSRRSPTQSGNTSGGLGSGTTRLSTDGDLTVQDEYDIVTLMSVLFDNHAGIIAGVKSQELRRPLQIFLPNEDTFFTVHLSFHFIPLFVFNVTNGKSDRCFDLVQLFLLTKGGGIDTVLRELPLQMLAVHADSLRCSGYVSFVPRQGRFEK